MSLAICELVQNLSTAIGLRAMHVQSWPVRENFGKNTIFFMTTKLLTFLKAIFS